VQSLRNYLPEGLYEQLRGKFVASYIGTHGMAHGLNTLIDAALLLRDKKNIHILMLGDGAERSALIERCAELGLENVSICGQVQRAIMPDIWSLSDVSLVLLKKSDLFKTVIPSKIFESMAMRKPIVLGVEGEVKTIIEKSGSGLCIEPENSQQLANAISTLYDSKELCLSMGRDGSEYVLAHFDRAVLAREFLDILYKTQSFSCDRKVGSNEKQDFPPGA